MIRFGKIQEKALINFGKIREKINSNKRDIRDVLLTTYATLGIIIIDRYITLGGPLYWSTLIASILFVGMCIWYIINPQKTAFVIRWLMLFPFYLANKGPTKNIINFIHKIGGGLLLLFRITYFSVLAFVALYYLSNKDLTLSIFTTHKLGIIFSDYRHQLLIIVLISLMTLSLHLKTWVKITSYIFKKSGKLLIVLLGLAVSTIFFGVLFSINPLINEVSKGLGACIGVCVILFFGKSVLKFASTDDDGLYYYHRNKIMNHKGSLYDYISKNFCDGDNKAIRTPTIESDSPKNGNNINEDGLNRVSWVELVFQDIKTICDSIIQNSSFSIGIVGAWGEGKSTVLNYLENQHLKNEKNMTVIHFNPWALDKSHLVEGLFSEILSHVGDDRDFRVKVFDYLSALGESVPNIGLIAGLINKFHPSNKSLQERKNELADILKNQNKKFIITIDDIDRCEPDEVICIMNIVKNLADLPNILYVMLYDRPHVEEVLIKRGFNPQYLDKIVNLEYELPKSIRSPMDSYVIDKLNDLNGKFGIHFDINFIMDSIILQHIGNMGNLRLSKKIMTHLEIWLHRLTQNINKPRITKFSASEIDEAVNNKIVSRYEEGVANVTYRDTLKSIPKIGNSIMIALVLQELYIKIKHPALFSRMPSSLQQNDIESYKIVLEKARESTDDAFIKSYPRPDIIKFASGENETIRTKSNTLYTILNEQWDS